MYRLFFSRHIQAFLQKRDITAKPEIMFKLGLVFDMD